MFLQCINWWSYGLHYQFIKQFFMSKCCVHQFELERSWGTVCSYHTKWQYFLRFALPLISHQLHHCSPEVKNKNTSPKKTSSATLPPKATQSWSQSIYFVMSMDSLGKYWAKPKDPFDLGMMVIFNKGDAPYKNHDVTACPHSWYATFLFSFSSSLNDCSIPASTRSDAS